MRKGTKDFYTSLGNALLNWNSLLALLSHPCLCPPFAIASLTHVNLISFELVTKKTL